VKFILYSHFAEDVIENHVGEPEYGYYFVLRAFRRVLADLGSVEVVRHPETEVGPIFAGCRARGEVCLFLPFAPAHKIPLNLECPTVPVIAWEFSTIPDGAWGDDPHNDWRFALGKVGRAITLSGHSARVIAEAMGPDFMIDVVPPPIRTQMDDAWPAEPVSIGLDIESGGMILDTARMDLDVNVLAPAARPRENDSRATERSWPGTGRNKHTITPPGDSQVRVSAGAVVYTAVLNPNDRSKNPYDLVTAFCWAFRDVRDTTLILKVCDHGLQSFYGSLIPILYKLSPFKCRVLVLPGFLQDAVYDSLIRATTYYVSASSAEGQCLPLMEFMSCGKPAIAAAHTAISDYIDNEVAFVLRASRQITSWPDDPRQLFRTMSFRLDWVSLREAFEQSYRLARTSPDHYREMSKRARERMQQHASPGVIKKKLRNFFSSVAASMAENSHGAHPAAEDFAGSE
jgi:glycosyltransferase involved in cell wall biosynthesis